MLIIEKGRHAFSADEKLRCPLTRTALKDYGDVYFSPDAYLTYPVIKRIPYLLSSHAILGYT